MHGLIQLLNRAYFYCGVYMKRIVVLVLVMISALSIGVYGGIDYVEGNVNSILDTRNSISNQIAIVNLDEGVVNAEGNSTYYSDVFLRLLNSNYCVESANGAIIGLENNRYSAVITFPADTSASVESLNSNEPKSLNIEYVINTNLSESKYIETNNLINDFKSEISNNLTYLYVTSVISELHQAQNDIETLYSNNEAVLDEIEALELKDYIPNLDISMMPQIAMDLNSMSAEEYLNQVNEITGRVDSAYLSAYQTEYDRIINELTALGVKVAQFESWDNDVEIYINESENAYKNLENNLKSYYFALLGYSENLLGENGPYMQLISNKANLNQYKENLDNWKESITNYVSSVKSYKEEIDESYSVLLINYGELTTYYDSLNTWYSELDSFAKDVNSSNTKLLNDLNEAIENKNKHIDSINSTIEGINDIISDKNKEISNVNGYYKEINDLIDYLETTSSMINERPKVWNDKDFWDKIDAVNISLQDYIKACNEEIIKETDAETNEIIEINRDEVELKIADARKEYDNAVRALIEYYNSSVENENDQYLAEINYLSDFREEMNNSQNQDSNSCGIQSYNPYNSYCNDGNNNYYSGNGYDGCEDSSQTNNEVSPTPSITVIPTLTPLASFTEVNQLNEITVSVTLSPVPTFCGTTPDANKYVSVPTISSNPGKLPLWDESKYDETKYNSNVVITEFVYNPTSSSIEEVTPTLSPTGETNAVEMYFPDFVFPTATPLSPMELSSYAQDYKLLVDGLNPNNLYANTNTGYAYQVNTILSQYGIVNRTLASDFDLNQVQNINEINQAYNTYRGYVSTMKTDLTNTYQDENDSFITTVDECVNNIQNINSSSEELLGDFSTRMPNSRNGSDINTAVVDVMIEPVQFANSTTLLEAQAASYFKVKSVLLKICIASLVAAFAMCVFIVLTNKRMEV